FLTVGDRQRFTPAQDPDQPVGKILRLTLDGKPAPGNPNFGRTGAATIPLIDPPRDTEAAKTAKIVSMYTFPGPNMTPAETWATGVRTPYGLAFSPSSELWEVEHGPRGGDELNLLEKGKNYGWPLVSFGENYNGVPIAKPDTRPDLAMPVLYWNPVIAPGNLMFYTGTRTFPQWNGNGFVSGLATMSLNRIIFDGHGGAKAAERWKVGRRIRDVEEGPDGSLWMLEDANPGALIHVTPLVITSRYKSKATGPLRAGLVRTPPREYAFGPSAKNLAGVRAQAPEKSVEPSSRKNIVAVPVYLCHSRTVNLTGFAITPETRISMALISRSWIMVPAFGREQEKDMKLWERVEYSAIVDRKPLRLPDNRTVAVWPLVTVEVWDPDEPLPRTILPPPQGKSFIPDVPNWTWAEYGMRIGFWRMKEALDRRGLKAVFCINGSVIDRYPRVCQAALEAGWEFMGHNIIQKPMHSMPNEKEAIQQTIAAIQKFTGTKPRGWMGPGLTETHQTPELLVAAGLEYTVDWVLDDQPVVIKTKEGPLYSVPYSVEVNDV